MKMRKLFMIVAIAAMTMAVTAGAAFAFDGHPGNVSTSNNLGVPEGGAWDGAAHTNWEAFDAADNCEGCHGGGGHGGFAGPHGGYTSTTEKCATCHTIHQKANGKPAAAVNRYLLPGATVTGVCNFCHDLTGSTRAPYSTALMSTAADVKSAHRVEGATINQGLSATVSGVVYNYLDLPGTDIPGGNANDGGALAFAGRLQQGTWANGADSGFGVAKSQFTCDSCHTPHAITGSTVNPYFGESERKSRGGFMVAGSRLLKAKLTVGGTAYSDYGSAWCAGCHMGRLTMSGSNYNHPVNSTATGLGYNVGMVTTQTIFNGSTQPANVYGYAYGAQGYVGSGNEATAAAIVNNGTMITPQGNDKEGVEAFAGIGTFKALGYGLQGSYAGSKYSGTWDMANSRGLVPALISKTPRFNSWYTMTAGDPLNANATRPDGYMPISNFTNGPSCQQCHATARDVETAFTTVGAAASFPHISTNDNLLVEANDDLCTNCHGLDNLP